jgi:apolipoprotein D and lipocalin family protein
MKRLVAICLLLTSHAHSAPLNTVAQVDFSRYQGLWYEIARFPNRFQKQCVGEVTALYEQNAHGLQVTNRCLLKDGQFEEAIGQARQPNPQQPAQLEVRFAPRWLSWLSAVWGDYWIVDLDPEYRYAAISAPNRDYLWILARQPQLDESTYQNLLIRLQSQGLAVEKLVKTPQAPPKSVGSKLN